MPAEEHPPQQPGDGGPKAGEHDGDATAGAGFAQGDAVDEQRRIVDALGGTAGDAFGDVDGQHTREAGIGQRVEDEHSTWTQDSAGLGDRSPEIGYVFEDLPRDHDVGDGLGQRQRQHVGANREDTVVGRVPQGRGGDVQPDMPVAEVLDVWCEQPATAGEVHEYRARSRRRRDEVGAGCGDRVQEGEGSRQVPPDVDQIVVLSGVVAGAEELGHAYNPDTARQIATAAASWVVGATVIDMGQPAAERWWRRGRDQAQAAAREAAGRAAHALIDLDREQTAAAEGVRMLAAVDSGQAARQVAAAWEPVREQANHAVATYMAAVSAADLDTDLEEPIAAHAAQAFRTSAEQLAHAVVAVRRFVEQSGRPLQQARAAHAAVPERQQAARVALTSAVRAVEAAQAAGYQAREAAHLVQQARSALAQLDRGVESIGLQGMLEGAARVIELSSRAEADAESLPGRAQALTQRSTSARTFLQVTEGHLLGVPEVMSELRRAYVYPSFADVEAEVASADAALAQGREHLDRAAVLSTPQEQRWGEADQAIAAARAAIDSAAHAAQSPRHRLAALRAAERDPGEPLRQTRRVLRDAQRFLLSGADQPSPQHVSRLDALGIQLDTVPDRLAARNRPDYWGYLTELAAVSDGARAVVDAVRQVRADR